MAHRKNDVLPLLVLRPFGLLQGLDELVEHFSGSRFDCHTEEYLPVRFEPPRDGTRPAEGAMHVVGRLAACPRSPRRRWEVIPPPPRCLHPGRAASYLAFYPFEEGADRTGDTIGLASLIACF